jgi:hypothetical protein
MLWWGWWWWCKCRGGDVDGVVKCRARVTLLLLPMFSPRFLSESSSSPLPTADPLLRLATSSRSLASSPSLSAIARSLALNSSSSVATRALSVSISSNTPSAPVTPYCLTRSHFASDDEGYVSADERDDGSSEGTSGGGLACMKLMSGLVVALALLKAEPIMLDIP